jgi:carbonic anhydrase
MKAAPEAARLATKSPELCDWPREVLPVRVSRRDLLRASGTAGMSGLVTVASVLTSPERAPAQTALSSDEALKALMDGNTRFIRNRLSAFQEDLDALKRKTAEKQEPFAAVLSCADSRVPVELVFDQSIGHVFVTRVAGNVAAGAIIASLEYGAAVLGTKLIMVLGHGGCGAVKAAMKAEEVPGQISGLYPYIRPALDQTGGNLETAVRANARFQAGILKNASPLIARLVQQHRLEVVAAYYNLTDGRVTLLD